MRYFIISLFLVISSSVYSQKKTGIDKKQLTKVWLLDSATFPSNVIKFRALNLSKDTLAPYNSYELQENSSINFKYYIPRGLGVCGNGIPYVKESKWVLKGKNLTIYMKGGYMAAGTYEYYIVYTIQKLSDTTLILKKKKVYKNKRCETCFE